MSRVYTHYDNLKVARNAPPEIIRAAYKTLSQKFHPDKNPGNRDAERIMAIINASYEVLSDPKRRYEHDLWIKKEESRQGTVEENEIINPGTNHNAKKIKGIFDFLFGAIWRVVRYVSFFAIIGVLLSIAPKFFEEKDSNIVNKNTEYRKPKKQAYIKPAYAPNGEPWPTSADYITGLPFLNSNGLSEVTVDNSRNNSDVFVKLFSLSSDPPIAVRAFFIPAYGKFTLKRVSPGDYDVRYQDLGNGLLSRSEAFNLKEIRTNNGSRYSIMSLTLYKVSHGNMRTYRIDESDF